MMRSLKGNLGWSDEYLGWDDEDECYGTMKMKRNKVEWKEEQREKGEDEKQRCNLGFNFVFMIFFLFSF